MGRATLLPLRSKQDSSSGRSRLWAGAVATGSRSHGAGDAPEICECAGLGGGAFSWLHEPGTKMKLGREGQQPDYGAGKISPLPHFPTSSPGIGQIEGRGKRLG